MVKATTTGLFLHIVLLVGLSTVCAFDDGRLTGHWRDCVVPVAIIAIPAVVSLAGVLWRSGRTLGIAAGLSLVIAVISITGPGIFVFVPGILYGIGAALWDPRQPRPTEISHI